MLYTSVILEHSAVFVAGGTPFSWSEEDVTNLYSADVLMSSDGTKSFKMFSNVRFFKGISLTLLQHGILLALYLFSTFAV